MRLKLTFFSSSQIILPIHCNYILHSTLYRNLPEKLANFLHNLGFFYKKRRFKLFTFSRIFSKYFNPLDPEFKILIKENIKKKYSIITGKELKDFDFNIEHIGKFKQVPVMYKKNETEKGYVVKAVHSKFKVKLSPEIFKAIYDAALGAKNSQGFGMIEVLNK